MHKEASLTYLKGSMSSLPLNIFLNDSTALLNSLTSALQYLTISILKLKSLFVSAIMFFLPKLELFTIIIGVHVPSTMHVFTGYFAYIVLMCRSVEKAREETFLMCQCCKSNSSFSRLKKEMYRALAFNCVKRPCIGAVVLTKSRMNPQGF